MPPCWDVGMEIRNKRKSWVCFLPYLFKILWQCSNVLLQGFWCKNILGGGTQLFCTLKPPFLYILGCWNQIFYFLKVFSENIFPLFTPWYLQKKNSVSEVKIHSFWKNFPSVSIWSCFCQMKDDLFVST